MALPDFSMRQLLEAGVHFGHQTHRWNPRMGEFIYGDRNGIHIIDLTQTVPMLEQALAVVRETVAAKAWPYPLCRHQASGTAPDGRRRRALRAVLHEPPLARRHADQLENCVELHRPPARDRRAHGTGCRGLDEERASGHGARPGQAAPPRSAVSARWAACPISSSLSM